jgi:hypothetical protein
MSICQDFEVASFAIGTRDLEHDACSNSDIGMKVGPGDAPYRYGDGRPYPSLG